MARTPPAAQSPAGSSDLTDRVRRALGGRDFTETQMFGGTAFMLDGKMVASASKRGLLVRVGRQGRDQALADPAARPVEMRPGRTMSGYVRVAEAGLTDSQLSQWLDRAIEFVRGITRPARAGKPPAKAR